MKKRVAVGLSGGVDSAVTAFLLKQEGYDVCGVSIRFTEHTKTEDGMRAAETIGIPFYEADFSTAFKDDVIDYFCKSYGLGQTPNPCVICNRFVKWEALLSKAEEIGADFVATGHYAKIIKIDSTGRLTLKKAKDTAKDQTYMLYNLTQRQLAKTLFPLGDYTKSQTRQIAKEAGLSAADKPDSQEICFIPDNDYASYILNNSDYTCANGNFTDINGNVIGRHRGIVHYTTGQRKGLGVGFGKRVFVKTINAETNEIVLCDDKELFEKSLTAKALNFMAIDSIKEGSAVRAKAKTRYSQKMADCDARQRGDELILSFDEEQRALTKGQAAVLYDETGEYILCGGIIS